MDNIAVWLKRFNKNKQINSLIKYWNINIFLQKILWYDISRVLWNYKYHVFDNESYKLNKNIFYKYLNIMSQWCIIIYLLSEYLYIVGLQWEDFTMFSH